MAPAVECGVCNTNPSKYKCPKCVLRYCSIACFKVHKETPCDQQASTQPPDAPPPAPAAAPSEPTVEAPSQQPQTEIKVEEKPWWHTQTEPVEGAYASLTHQDDHVVGKEVLARLGESAELRAMLQQRDLRELLVQLHNKTATVRSVGDAEGAIMDALKDPQFAQFADTCLSTLGMKDPAQQDGLDQTSRRVPVAGCLPTDGLCRMEPDPDKVSPFWLHKDVSIDFAEQPMIFEALAVSGDQRFGFSVQKVHASMCVSLVLPGSMAESAGLVVGDHILMCNGMQLRYATTDSMLTDLGSLPTIDLLVADCPFDVTVSMVRSQGQSLGLNLENGKIVSVTEGSLSAQYPIPLDHYLVEVNHDCVIGIHGPRLQRIIQQAGNVVSLRMMPAAEFELLLQRVGGSASVRQVMDNYLLQLGRLEEEVEVEEPPPGEHEQEESEESSPPQNEPSLFKRLFW